MASKRVFVLVLENDLEKRISHLLSTISTDTDEIQIQIATTADDALLLLQTSSFTLILLGLPFNGVIGDGLNLLVQLRQLNPRVPIVVLVNQDTIGLGLQALEFGAYAYFSSQHLSESDLQRIIRNAAVQESVLQASPPLSEQDTVLLNSFPACIAVLDERGVVTAVNAGWQELARRSSDPLIQGTDANVSFPQLCQEVERSDIAIALQRVLDGVRAEQAFEFSWMQENQLTWWKVYITAMRWPYGGAILSIQEVTDVVSSQIRLSAYEAEISELKHGVVSLVHELRTPLTAIRLYLNLLKHADTPKTNQYLAILHQETVHLEQYVDDLLTLSHLEQMEEPLFKILDFMTLVEQVVVEQSPVAEAKGLFLNLRAAQEQFLVRGQSRLLNRIVTNLVGNAIRYTIRGGIHVSVARDAAMSRIVLKVEDSGIGIAQEVLPHIFEPFFRSPRAQNLIQRGSGLGLDIVKRILTLHGGTIEVSSDLNNGSVFWVFLPAYPDSVRG